MAKKRLPMRKIKDVLRLKYLCGLSEREVARSCGLARSTVGGYLDRAKLAGLDGPKAMELTEAELGARLFSASHPVLEDKRPLPDCQHIYDEIRSYKRLNLTLAQLWLEYKEEHPQGYQYTQFCRYYRLWRSKLDYCMRQEHRAGEKLFVDYCDGLAVIDLRTGELIPTELFVAVWGASSYTYAEASLTQELPAWIGAHVRAFQYFASVPRAIVPDNLKSGVTKPCFYEPELNSTYAEMAAHYGCAVLPARPRRPRDKAKVESGVLLAQRWILAVLRHRTFYSLAELNSAILALLERLNTRKLRRMGKSRKELFEGEDKPHALPLPERPYEYAEWRKATVNIDYHIEADNHYYSIPFQLLRERLDVRLTATTLEALFKGERVAAHARSYVKGGYTTLPDHMPLEHRRYADWTPSRIIQWAGKTGVATAKLVEKILDARTFPEQGYRSCLGILRLSHHYTPDRVEAAAKRALEFNTCSYKSMKAILVAGLDREAVPDKKPLQMSLPLHENVRGQDYYR